MKTYILLKENDGKNINVYRTLKDAESEALKNIDPRYEIDRRILEDNIIQFLITEKDTNELIDTFYIIEKEINIEDSIDV